MKATSTFYRASARNRRYVDGISARCGASITPKAESVRINFSTAIDCLQVEMTRDEARTLAASLLEYSDSQIFEGRRMTPRKLDNISLALVKAARPRVPAFPAMRFAAVVPDDAHTIPPDPEDMNPQRALAALDTLIHFASSIGELPEEGASKQEQSELLHQNLQDLLCDFAHLCDRTGLQFEATLTGARSHYEAETDGRGRQF